MRVVSEFEKDMDVVMESSGRRVWVVKWIGLWVRGVGR